MAKATKTIREALQYPAQYAHYFAENAALFNRVVAFYFAVIQAHEGILALNNKAATQGAIRSQTEQKGQEEAAISGAATGPAAHLEQVGPFLRYPVERTPYSLHHAQSLDRLLLVLAEAWGCSHVIAPQVSS